MDSAEFSGHFLALVPDLLDQGQGGTVEDFRQLPGTARQQFVEFPGFGLQHALAFGQSAAKAALDDVGPLGKNGRNGSRFLVDGTDGRLDLGIEFCGNGVLAVFQHLGKQTVFALHGLGDARLAGCHDAAQLGELSVESLADALLAGLQFLGKCRRLGIDRLSYCRNPVFQGRGKAVRLALELGDHVLGSLIQCGNQILATFIKAAGHVLAALIKLAEHALAALVDVAEQLACLLVEIVAEIDRLGVEAAEEDFRSRGKCLGELGGLFLHQACQGGGIGLHGLCQRAQARIELLDQRLALGVHALDKLTAFAIEVAADFGRLGVDGGEPVHQRGSDIGMLLANGFLQRLGACGNAVANRLNGGLQPFLAFVQHAGKARELAAHIAGEAVEAFFQCLVDRRRAFVQHLVEFGGPAAQRFDEGATLVVQRVAQRGKACIEQRLETGAGFLEPGGEIGHPDADRILEVPGQCLGLRLQLRRLGLHQVGDGGAGHGNLFVEIAGPGDQRLFQFRGAAGKLVLKVGAAGRQ